MYLLFSIFFFLVLSPCLFANAQTLTVVGTISIQASVVDRDNSVRTIELLTSKNQSAGKYRAADVVSCLKGILGKVPPEKRSYTVILVKSSNGQQLVISLPELLPEISKLSPMLVYRKVVGDLTDTARVQDVSGEVGKINVKDIDAYLERATQERIKLQFANLQDVKKFLGQPISIIFPTDATSGRWLADLESLTVAIIE